MSNIKPKPKDILTCNDIIELEDITYNIHKQIRKIKSDFLEDQEIDGLLGDFNQKTNFYNILIVLENMLQKIRSEAYE